MSDKPTTGEPTHEVVKTDTGVRIDPPDPTTAEQPVMRNPKTGKDHYASELSVSGAGKPTGKWTAHKVKTYIGVALATEAHPSDSFQACCRLADAINAALAAERKKLDSVLATHDCIVIVKDLEQQLAAERRERCEVCNNELSQCGVQGMDGEPSLDCLLCRLRDQLAALVDTLRMLEYDDAGCPMAWPNQMAVSDAVAKVDTLQTEKKGGEKK